MNIGSLYTVKKWFWLLFPTKETSHAEAHHGADRESVAFYANWLSKELKCEVTYFSPDSYIVLLEEDGKFKNLLTSDGKLGWTWCDERYNSSFEEVKKES